MAKSQQTFNKSEKEKKRLKKREEKRKKMEARKAAAKESGKKGIEFAYVDHDGNLTDTPPDPSKKIKVEAESIEISIPKTLESDKEEIDPVRNGKVSFFDSSKGFGFIIDAENQEKYFTHVSGLIDEIAENDKVSFELEKGMKGMNAVKVTLLK
ncbi:cold shock domain-containing protein [Flavobacteriaceae bacterium 3-367]|uniref:cold-shock protein n=1 Tax=Eudoraea algarum TaxID=3417568 RepID=UPI0032689AE7